MDRRTPLSSSPIRLIAFAACVFACAGTPSLAQTRAIMNSHRDNGCRGCARRIRVCPQPVRAGRAGGCWSMIKVPLRRAPSSRRARTAPITAFRSQSIGRSPRRTSMSRFASSRSPERSIRRRDRGAPDLAERLLPGARERAGRQCPLLPHGEGPPEQLATADVKVASGEWHTLGLKAENDRFTVSFNGRRTPQAPAALRCGPSRTVSRASNRSTFTSYRNRGRSLMTYSMKALGCDPARMSAAK